VFRETHDGGRTRNVVIVCGWSANPAVLLVPSHGRPASYPGIATDFERAFATLRALPCDIFLGAHGVYFDLLAKHDRLAAGGPSVWIDPGGYAKALAEHEADYREELARQHRAYSAD
jgi:metallo-beta-lactamase class B